MGRKVNLEQYVAKATEYPSKVIAVAAAEDVEVIDAVIEAVEKGIASFRLFGDKEKINLLLSKKNSSFSKGNEIEVVGTSDEKEAAQKAVQSVRNGESDVLMKGLISTSVILKEVLNKEYGLSIGKVLSHVAVFQIPDYDRLIFVTDSAMNITPDLNQKAEIIRNAVEVARALGIELPKVAIVAAVETVNPKMIATVDAALLTQMNKRGQIKNCIVDGPLGLDNAISKHAAELKEIKSEVAGLADIIMVPTVEVGNILYKSLIYFSKAKVGALIAGAMAPIVLTSRADNAQSKLYSLALAIRSVS